MAGRDEGFPDIGAPRGRARSRTFSAEDKDFVGEIDAFNAVLDGKPLPADGSKQAGDADAAAAKPQLSSRTVKIMTKLDVALATPPELASAGGARATEDDEEAAERALAEEERRKRAQAPPPDATQSSRTADGRAVGAASKRPAAKGKKADEPYDVQIKLLLLGDSGVGKTSLMVRFSDNEFSTSLLSTAGVDYKTSYMDTEGKTVKVQIWDTAGQQRFHVITHSYYKSAHGIVLVYDAADPTEESFNNVRYWMENIQKHANPLTQKILIGNKIDMKGKKVEHARGKALADEYAMRFYETSAKDGTGVREAFQLVARDIVQKILAAGPDAAAAGAGAGGEGKGKDKKDCAIM